MVESQSARKARQPGERCCADSLLMNLSPQQLDRLGERLHLLGHPVRLQILLLLARNEGKICVCDLESLLPVKQPTVSHHLKLLREGKLIKADRDGLWAFYFLDRDEVRKLKEQVTGLLSELP